MCFNKWKCSTLANRDDLIIWMLVDMKFYIDIGGGYIDIESFYTFRQFLIAPAPNLLQY
jgi:hypothetical protein